MTFVSFAQNQEDVMLYRALRDVNNGFYIDVGAMDPVIASVTKAFYERGWHGINVEPSEEYSQKLQSERPHDINLATAVGREPGSICFYEVAHTGDSSTNPEYALRRLEAGCQVTRREVPCTTLDRICADYGVATVHFLKIDVEGSERGVLEGFSFETVRPWLVVIEATEPYSEREVFAEWEDLLLGRSYRFIYFDGVNRFYAAEEHADLARHFSRPPNWFDQYVSYELCHTRAELHEVQAAERSLRKAIAEREHILRKAMAEREETMQEAMVDRDRQLGNLQEALAERERQLTSLQEAVAQRERLLGSLQEAMAERARQLGGLQTKLAKTEHRLRSMRSSVSWKLTSPLREMRRAAVRIIGLFRRPKPHSDVATSAFASSDLAASDEVAARLNEPARLLYRNLRDSVTLRRWEKEKRMLGERRI